MDQQSNAPNALDNSQNNKPNIASPNPYSKKTWLLILSIAVVAILAAGGGVFAWQKWFSPVPSPSIHACIQDAKQCPDGSYVGRTGPNCEFAECPSASPSVSPDATADWQTYRNQEYGFEVKYPDVWQKYTEHDPPYPREGVLYLKSIEFNKDFPGETGFNVDVYERNKVMDYTAINTGVGLFLKAGFNGQLAECASPVESVMVGTNNYSAKLVYTPPQDKCFQEVYFYYLQKGNYDYFITPRPAGGVGYIGYDGKTKTQNSLPEFNQILSTFKFIPQ
ncbi:hypothetical protein KJ853_02465 [Patescibacteria group bacterium]|nr:hypothetical protein [Patescibacteria group bacterium]